jgi:hypothetical protein
MVLDANADRRLECLNIIPLKTSVNLIRLYREHIQYRFAVLTVNAVRLQGAHPIKMAQPSHGKTGMTTRTRHHDFPNVSSMNPSLIDPVDFLVFVDLAYAPTTAATAGAGISLIFNHKRSALN